MAKSTRFLNKWKKLTLPNLNSIAEGTNRLYSKKPPKSETFLLYYKKNRQIQLFNCFTQNNCQITTHFCDGLYSC